MRRYGAEAEDTVRKSSAVPPALPSPLLFRYLTVSLYSILYMYIM